MLAHPAVLMDCKPPCRESRAGRMSTLSSALAPSLPLFPLCLCLLSRCENGAARSLALFTSLGSSSFRSHRKASRTTAQKKTADAAQISPLSLSRTVSKVKSAKLSCAKFGTPVVMYVIVSPMLSRASRFEWTSAPSKTNTENILLSFHSSSLFHR